MAPLGTTVFSLSLRMPKAYPKAPDSNARDKNTKTKTKKQNKNKKTQPCQQVQGSQPALTFVTEESAKDTGIQGQRRKQVRVDYRAHQVPQGRQSNYLGFSSRSAS